MPTIRFLKSGDRVVVNREHFVVSGSRDADCRVDDPLCNPVKHFEIQRVASGYLLIPLDEVSVNGVTANGNVYLNFGDRICVGHTFLLFEQDDHEEQETRFGSAEGLSTHAVDIRVPDSMGLILGRESSRQVHCLDHPLVSRRHASLAKNGNTVSINDLGSSNGTFVNGRRIQAETSLSSGDQIGIGPFQFVWKNDLLVPQNTTGHSSREQSGLSATLVCHGIGRAIAKTGHTLLRDIDLNIEPGQFVCIVGPSGAGKSTLLKALAGREVPDCRISAVGHVELNGIDLQENFQQLKQHFAFVPQHEILFEDLDLESMLRYTARLRLPKDASRSEISQQIDQVLRTVQLVDCRNKRICNLSGGQRKRAALANELLAQPSLLFVDEVTSGLDELTDSEMMQLFRKIADEGKTVVCVTHSVACVPRDCHSLVALTRFGRLAFHGTPEAALKHFGIDRINDMYGQLAVGTQEAADRVADKFRFATNKINVAQARRVQDTRLSSRSHRQEFDLGFSFRQFHILVQRSAHRTVFNLRTNILRALQVGIVGLLMCSVFGDVNAQEPGVAKNLSFILVLSCFWFGCNNSSKEIVCERRIFEQERSVGLRPHSFAWEKVSVLSVIAMFQSMALFFGVRWWCEIPGNLTSWTVLVAVVSFVGTGIGLAISAFSRREETAVAAVPIVLIPQIILAGVVAKLEGINLWFAETSISAYAGMQASHKIIANSSELFPGDSRFWIGMMVVQAAIAFVAILLSLQRKHC